MANMYTNNVRVQDYLKGKDWAIAAFTYSDESTMYAGEKGIFLYDKSKPFGEDFICHCSKGVADFYYANNKSLPAAAYVGQADDQQYVMHLSGTRTAESDNSNTKFV